MFNSFHVTFFLFVCFSSCPYCFYFDRRILRRVNAANRCRCHRVTESVLRELGRWSASYWRPGAARGECIYVGYQSDNVAPACDKAAIVVVMYKPLVQQLTCVNDRLPFMNLILSFLVLYDLFSFINRPSIDLFILSPLMLPFLFRIIKRSGVSRIRYKFFLMI